MTVPTKFTVLESQEKLIYLGIVTRKIMNTVVVGVSRIVLGYDGRIVNVPFVKDAIVTSGNDQISTQLQGLEYLIQWGTMTLQDAMDYCRLMIQTTSAIQRFSDGIRADPGDMPGVGGPIDIAVITPDKGFVWINKKKLKFDDTIVDLEKQEELTNKSNN